MSRQIDRLVDEPNEAKMVKLFPLWLNNNNQTNNNNTKKKKSKKKKNFYQALVMTYKHPTPCGMKHNGVNCDVIASK